MSSEHIIATCMSREERGIDKRRKIHNICPYRNGCVYMCVYLLLLVTVTVFSHCRATEYYVRPTESTIPPVLVVYIHLIDECVCRTQP